ncbi:MAG: hypothetical protein ACI4L8_07625, partial [Candidatus Fimadaptatus sp.]
MDFRSIGNMRYAKIYQFLRLHPRFPRVPALLCADLCVIHSCKVQLIRITCAIFIQSGVLIVITGFDPVGAAGRQVRDFVAYGPVCRAQVAPGENARGRAGILALQSKPEGVAKGVALRQSGASLRGAPPLGQGDFAMPYILLLLCRLWGAFLRRFWLRQQPRGSLRRPRR